MFDPPFDGVSKEIVACVFPRVATIFVGAFGVVAGTIEFDVPEFVLVPTEFVAVTVNVYEVPFVSPVTTIEEVAPTAVCPPLDVTV